GAVVRVSVSIARLTTLLACSAVLADVRCIRAASPPATRHGAPLLWRVERYGATSHLFGTVHVPFDLDTALGEEGRQALPDAKRVFVELDDLEGLTFLREAMGRALLPERQSLH